MVDKVSRKNASRFMRSHFEFKKHEIEIREFHVRTIPRSIKTERDSSLDCYENPTAFGSDWPSETTVEGCNTSKCIAERSNDQTPTHSSPFGWSLSQQARIQTHFETSKSRCLCFNLCLQWCIVVFGSTGAHCEPEKKPICHKQEQDIQRTRRSVGCVLTDRVLTDRQLYSS